MDSSDKVCSAMTAACSSTTAFLFLADSNARIYCGEVVNSTYLYLGADNGLLTIQLPDRYP